MNLFASLFFCFESLSIKFVVFELITLMDFLTFSVFACALVCVGKCFLKTKEKEMCVFFCFDFSLFAVRRICCVVSQDFAVLHTNSVSISHLSIQFFAHIFVLAVSWTFAKKWVRKTNRFQLAWLGAAWLGLVWWNFQDFIFGLAHIIIAFSCFAWSMDRVH